jgi:hypothetical protein
MARGWTMAEVIVLPLRLSASGDTDSVRLVHAEHRRDIAAIRRFRFLTYLQPSDMVVDDSAALDERGHLFGLLAHGEIVACARVLPLPDEGAGINQFDHGAIAARAAPTEVGRLAVTRHRSPLLLLAMLGLGARWMVEHTRHERFIAFCDRRFVPAYERVGAEDLASSWSVRADPARTGSWWGVLTWQPSRRCRFSQRSPATTPPLRP